MDIKLFREICRVEKDKTVDGNEIVILYAREEGAQYSVLIFRRNEFGNAYDTIERYKKTGELEVISYQSLGRVTEVIRPVCMLVAEMQYGYRAMPEITVAESE